jgi:dTDP-4-dehydrorhamnose reductase
MQMNKRDILVLGGAGRLSSSLVSAWSKTHNVTALSRTQLNVGDLDELSATLEATPFDILINGAAFTNVDLCETERDTARLVNATAAGRMAAIASARGARLIHFSTDYVFDGSIPRPLTEVDTPSPKSWYGQTKREGEELVLAADPSHLVVRVSWVFGPAKPSFIDAILKRAHTESRVEAVEDKFSSPTYAEDCAEWLAPFLDAATPGGLYHACNSGSCSWREYGQTALELASAAGIPLATTKVGGIRLADMKQFVAPRPVHTVLDTSKLARATGMSPRPWQNALKHYIQTHHASISSAN